ncbi:eukaryotic type KH-domain (KH-domain type I) [Ceraceosorus guamensis]|uniref:Pre-rRNA-processing protein PNO1 n=1 Tax=Ceraceosorus guamensis TaxID=1522189 RepID=A0A316W9Z9_9BASI|nr:eukaryotic type KH-domain (KH-domain type I) [Ceraceosorus guamensis]PWN45898.1 eukaryotic type KH-domain (KH-domain type I) [Ceraceosorus guamensis]
MPRTWADIAASSSSAPAPASNKGKGKASQSAKDLLLGKSKQESKVLNPLRKVEDDEDEAMSDVDGDDDAADVGQDAGMDMDDDDDLLIGSSSGSKPKGTSHTLDQTHASALDPSLKPSFAPLTRAQQSSSQTSQIQSRRVPIPPHRMAPLKKEWLKIYTPLVEMAGLQVRMNMKRKSVDIRSSKHTDDAGQVQKGADFVKAFALGFEADDAMALLRMDDLYVETFEIKDVKTLQGDHLSRAIGRIAGKDGRTRFAIENASRTRVVLADNKIHILGSFQNIRIARDAIVSLIMGAPPGKVYNKLKVIGARQKQRA